MTVEKPRGPDSASNPSPSALPAPAPPRSIGVSSASPGSIPDFGLILGRSVDRGLGERDRNRADGAAGVVVARDRIGDAVGSELVSRIATTGMLSLFASWMAIASLLVSITKIEVGQAAHLLDAAQRALELVALAGQVQQLLLGEAWASPAVEHLVELAQALDRCEMVFQLVSVPPSQRWLT